MKRCLLLVATVLSVACSTRPVPGVCCIGAEDCHRLGLTEDRPCPAGQACVDLECAVPSCSIQGCAANAPVCDVTTDVCTGCTSSSDCSRFSGSDVCDPQTGGCVECLAASDCSVAEPICDGGSCRGCRLDAECPSGACGEDGACVPEANIVYLHPDGLDVGTCERSAPCQRIQFGATKASLNRNHIVLIAGQYDLGAQTEYITSQTTLAPKLFIHGGGSVIHTTAEVGVITTYVDAVIRDLEIVGNGEGLLIGTPGPSVLERVKIRGPNAQGIVVNSDVTMRDISIEDAGFAILLQGAARLTLDRGSIRNPYVGISSNANTVIVNITNLLVFGATNMAFDLTFSAGGTVNFTTIADSGTDAGSGPRAFKCGVSGPIIRSSIIWAPGTVARPAIDSGCTLISTIVGPTAVPGATNVDPLFVNAAVRDYHLSAGSPARDMVDSGPALDFEGDPRPRGARFDIGADEAP